MVRPSTEGRRSTAHSQPDDVSRDTAESGDEPARDIVGPSRKSSPDDQPVPVPVDEDPLSLEVRGRPGIFEAGELRPLAHPPLRIDVPESAAPVPEEKGRESGVVRGEDVEVPVPVGVGDAQVEEVIAWTASGCSEKRRGLSPRGPPAQPTNSMPARQAASGRRTDRFLCFTKASPDVSRFIGSPGFGSQDSNSPLPCQTRRFPRWG